MDLALYLPRVRSNEVLGGEPRLESFESGAAVAANRGIKRHAFFATRDPVTSGASVICEEWRSKHASKAGPDKSLCHPTQDPWEQSDKQRTKCEHNAANDRELDPGGSSTLELGRLV